MADLEQMARRLFLENCQVGPNGALERYGEKPAVAAIMTILSMSKEVLVASLTSELSLSYDCTRCWSAWGYGTMGQDDFEPVSDRVEEIAAGLIDCHMATLLVMAGADEAPEPEADQPKFNEREHLRTPWNEPRSWEDREAHNLRVHGLSEDDIA